MNQILLFEQQAEEKRRLMDMYNFERPGENKPVLKNPWKKPYALLVAISARQVGTFAEHFPNRRLWRKEKHSGTVPERKAATPDPEPQFSEKENETVWNVRESLDGGDMPPRLTDRMYFVLDVEMVLNFEEPMDTRKKYLEELSKLVLPGTAGSMLYIPHIVIEEIDWLNMEQMLYATKVLTAERAIQYLNKKFDSSFEIQAQSPKEEQDHLFQVCTTEDSIVNSCLQLQEEVPNLMLITYSGSLRRTAKSMGIHVSSYPALREQYPAAFAALEEKLEPLQEVLAVEERSLY
ncbi:uncharacterized protein LOC117582248 [Drosophila guanche]|uniref:PIN domain-containing protein n=1 Tax=Drosophila guanche TaxID=7266 RepID=A0A3B0K8V0_DROGU|nr:uncharacterized protein LOC117582248 [Drosophila guanche]SPP79958.1 Hypothetical predicted protein [Drosophila guanche]